MVVRHGQRVFAEAVEQYLVNIEYGSDQYASRIRLPNYRKAEVLADPLRSFGHPILARGGASSRRSRRTGHLAAGDWITLTVLTVNHEIF